MAAARKSYLLLYPNLTRPDPITPEDPFEFDESDIWSGPKPTQITPSPETKIPKPSKRPFVKQAVGATAVPAPRATAASLPVNIPDWSKILGGGGDRRLWKDGGDGDSGGDEGEDDREWRVPPHEYLARTRRASMSVHEGVGRTLKGRDLSRVRNAIWKRIGFED